MIIIVRTIAKGKANYLSDRQGTPKTAGAILPAAPRPATGEKNGRLSATFLSGGPAEIDIQENFYSLTDMQKNPVLMVWIPQKSANSRYRLWTRRELTRECFSYIPDIRKYVFAGGGPSA